MAAVIIFAAGTVAYGLHQTHAFFEPRKLLSRFPSENSLALSVDVAALRSAGLLQQSSTPTEAEYKQFIEGTGFDYRRDLDSVFASFARSGTYFIARGRFDWIKLRQYAAQQGGTCYQELCRIQGSRPERHISFLPLRKDALALAVSTSDLAATQLTRMGQPLVGDIPSAPAWITVPGAELQRRDALPPEMHSVLSALGAADRVVVTFGIASAQVEAHLEATCKTASDALLLTNQLRSTTALLKEALVRDKKLSSDEFASVLTAGTFTQNDRRVTGRWPIGRGAIQALTDGI
jgi:hypothetical protein